MDTACYIALALALVIVFVLWADKIIKMMEKHFNILIVRKFLVRKHQKGLLFKENDFKQLLLPGEYWVFDPLKKHELIAYDLNKPLFESELTNYFIEKHPELIEEHFYKVDLSDVECGLLYQEGKLREVVPPAARRLYWKGIIETSVQVLNIEQNYEVPEKYRDLVVRIPGTFEKLELSEVKDHSKALLFVNGKYIKLLEPGIHAFWKFNKFIEIKHVDLRLQTVEVNGQEIITKDKVTLRVNMNANYQVIDPVTVIKELPDYYSYIYRELQFGLREALGTNTLDELLEKKEEINQVVLKSVVDKLATYGISLKEVSIKDYILPGDMRELLNQVVAAEKQAQANLIHRREETAATRSLLNTAKLMENNATLLRLKELEALEKITAKVQNISVYGGLDGLLQELVKFKSQDSQ
jgi:regulator of protease activity HflC (stomatin/prohibitin superfamily)